MNDTIKPTLNFPEIDEQHKYLYFLFDNLVISETMPVEKMKKLLQEIERYILFHFTCEEHLMKMYQFPGFAIHQSDHEFAGNKLIQFMDDFDRNALNPKAMHIFLTGWLMEHSNLSDSEYVKWIKHKREMISVE